MYNFFEYNRNRWLVSAHDLLFSFVQSIQKGTVFSGYDPQEGSPASRTRILWCCRLLLARHPLLLVLLCPIRILDSFGLWSTLHVLAFDFHDHVSAGRCALWCRKIRRVLPYGFCSSRGRKLTKGEERSRPRGEQWTVAFHEHRTLLILPGIWERYENDEICLENSLKL